MDFPTWVKDYPEMIAELNFQFRLLKMVEADDSEISTVRRKKIIEHLDAIREQFTSLKRVVSEFVEDEPAAALLVFRGTPDKPLLPLESLYFGMGPDIDPTNLENIAYRIDGKQTRYEMDRWLTRLDNVREHYHPPRAIKYWQSCAVLAVREVGGRLGIPGRDIEVLISILFEKAGTEQPSDNTVQRIKSTIENL